MSNIKWYCTIGSSNIIFWHLTNFALTRLLFLGFGFVRLDLKYYLIMVSCNTELQYWVIQPLRKHHAVHCLSLLMLSLWCYLYLHFQSFTESSFCFMEFLDDILAFIIIFFCIFSELHESSSSCLFGGVVGVIIIVMLILGIIFFRRKKGNLAHIFFVLCYWIFFIYHICCNWRKCFWTDTHSI